MYTSREEKSKVWGLKLQSYRTGLRIFENWALSVERGSGWLTNVPWGNGASLRNFQDGLSDTTSKGQFGARLVEGEEGKLALVIGEGNNVNGDNGRYRYDSTNGTYVYMSGVNTKTAVYDGNNDGITEEHSQPETSEALGSNEASLPEHLIERATETGDWMSLAKAGINPFSVDIGNTLNPVGRFAAGEEFKRRERARNRGENPDDPETGRTSTEKSTEWVLDRTVNRS